MTSSHLHLTDCAAVPPDQFRAVAGLFATGVTVVSTLHGDIGRGMTANSFTSVSLDPLLVLLCVRQDSDMCRMLQAHGGFTVSVLGADQQDVAAWFADPARPPGRTQFDRAGWHPGAVTGMPLIAGAAAWLECATAERLSAGDHLVVFGRVLSATIGEPCEPLLFYAGRFGSVAPLAPVTARVVGD